MEHSNVFEVNYNSDTGYARLRSYSIPLSISMPYVQPVASSRTLALKPMLHARYSALYYMPSSLKGWPGANARYTAATDRPRRSDVLNSPALALRGSS